jgi:hypothetical protein
VLFGILLPFFRLGVWLPIELDVVMSHLFVINAGHYCHIPLFFNLMRLFPEFNQGWIKAYGVVILFGVMARELIVPTQPVLVNSLL